MSDIEITDLPVESTSEPEITKPGDQVDVTPLKNFIMGKNEPTLEEGENMAFIWDYYSRQASGPGVALGMISDVERSLSQPPPGVSRLEHLYTYVKLLSQQGDIDAEIKAYKRY